LGRLRRLERSRKIREESVRIADIKLFEGASKEFSGGIESLHGDLPKWGGPGLHSDLGQLNELRPPRSEDL
jgi:hypothetical protein